MARFESAGFEFSEIASAGNVEGIYELGLIYATGRGCDPDLIAAHKWFNIAAFRGYGPAKSRREELAAEMSRDQIAAAQRAARDWIAAH